MTACPECGTEPDAGRFCGHCGAALSAPHRDAPRRDVPDDGPDTDPWEAHDRSRRRWGAGALAAVATGLVVAAVVATAGETRPGADQAAPDTPVGTTLFPTRGPDAPPPLPVTTAGDCRDPVPGCVAWHTDFPGTLAISPPVLGADPRHAYLVGSTADGAGALYAIDPGNGIQLWRRTLPGPPQPPIVTPWRTVAVTYDDPRAGAGVREFDPETGELRWQAEVASAAQVPVPPAAAGSTLAVAAPERMLLRHLEGNAVTIVEYEGSPTGLLGAGDDLDATFLLQTDLGEVTAYAPDGSVRWNRTSTVLGTAIRQGRTALLDLSGHVVGVDVRTGERWRARLDVLRAPPVVAGDEAIVVMGRGELARLSLLDGRELGRVPLLPGQVTGPFAVAGGTAYLPSCAGVTALDLISGQGSWTTDLDAPEGACANVPVVPEAADVELLVSATNRLYGLVPSAP